MGYGDSLIALALAQEEYARDPSRGPVAILDADGSPRWRPEWVGQAAVLWPPLYRPKTSPTLRLHGGCLPYYPWSRKMKWRVSDHRATLAFDRYDQKQASKLRAKHGAYILIEPPALHRKNRNRCWPGWAELAALLQSALDVPLLQLEHSDVDRLPGIPGIPHRNFTAACAILQCAALSVLAEGGITIAAGTVGAPAVVLWGGCASVETFGYPEHVNLVDADPRTPCGMSRVCDHCTAAWARLTPEYVAETVLQTWQARKAAA